MITHNNQTYKVVVCVPAGRQKYLSIFKKFLYRKLDEGILDNIQLWLNTAEESDIKYLLSMEAENPKVKIYRIGEPILTPTYDYAYGKYNPLKTYMFFQNAQEDDTIYIRFDDDIIWCADDAIEKICQARIDNPNAFLITPNVVNSTTWTSWHQEIGALSEEVGKVRRYTPIDPNYAYLHEFNYSDSRFFDHIHTTFRKHYENGTLDKYYLPSRSLTNYERFSICCICWWGKDKIKLGHIEEPQLAHEIPIALERPNYLCGDALMVHCSYHTQYHYAEASGDIHLKFYESITK